MDPIGDAARAIVAAASAWSTDQTFGVTPRAERWIDIVTVAPYSLVSGNADCWEANHKPRGGVSKVSYVSNFTYRLSTTRQVKRCARLKRETAPIAPIEEVTAHRRWIWVVEV